MRRVCVLGIGETGNRETTPTLSYKELMFEAATRAYADAGVDARRDVESAVSVAEDFWWGTSITDEYVPDQIGAAMKPVCTVGGDGLQGLATAYMQIASGLVDVVVVEAHSKVSDVVHPDGVMALAHEPFWFRPFGWNAHVTAGLEMARFLHETGTPREAASLVVEKNRRNALRNPLAAYGSALRASDVESSPVVSHPLRRLDLAEWADGAACVVLASEDAAQRFSGSPVWIRGLSWASTSPNLDSRNWGAADYAQIAARRAFKLAGFSPRDVDVAEVDDTYSYKELQHLEALGLAPEGGAHQMLSDGAFDADGELPVNPSGGCLGMGQTIEQNGLSRLCEVVRQLRGQASGRQVPDARVGLAQGWRGVPTTTGAVALLSTEVR